MKTFEYMRKAWVNRTRSLSAKEGSIVQFQDIPAVSGHGEGEGKGKQTRADSDSGVGASGNGHTEQQTNPMQNTETEM